MWAVRVSCRNNQQKIPKRVYTCLEEVGAASRDELFYVIFNHLPKVVGQQMGRHKAADLPLFRKAHLVRPWLYRATVDLFETYWAKTGVIDIVHNTVNSQAFAFHDYPP